MRRAMSLAVAAALALVIFALPAGATVDEITGMPCSGGNAVFGPPGITGGSHADNFAKPLFATGFLMIVPYPAGGPDAILFTFDTTHPASKITLTGTIIEEVPGLVYFADFVWDATKPFANCKKFAQPHP